jgi:thioredoxin-like negative regulator of GroEL
VIDDALALAPARLNFLLPKVLTYLSEGNLAGARAAMAAAPPEVDRTAMVAYFATYQDLSWVLDQPETDVLLRLTPAAFSDDRATWALALAQANLRRGNTARARELAEEARRELAAQTAANPGSPDTRAALGMALAYLGRYDEAVREGERALALVPSGRTTADPYNQHQLVCIYALAGRQDKAIDLLEPLATRVPYYLTPAWLRIDPAFDPLRGHPRFQKLVAGT